jgi:hypothetical protein
MACDRYRIRTVDEVLGMASRLAQYFADPADAMTGIHELLMNAIEHGNLGIGYTLKTQLLEHGTWEAEIAARMMREPYASRVVEIAIEWGAAWATLSIVDEGDGFDWAYYIHRDVAEAWNHGRGLYLAKQCGFSSLVFNPCGNAVTCRGTASIFRPAPGGAMTEPAVIGATVASVP